MAVVEPVTVLLDGKIAATLSTDGVTRAVFTYADGYLNDRAADVWVCCPAVGDYNGGTITTTRCRR